MEADNPPESTEEPSVTWEDTTSPSQLQEVTLDQDVSTFGYLHVTLTKNFASRRPFRFVVDKSNKRHFTADFRHFFKHKLKLKVTSKVPVWKHQDSMGIKSPTAMRGRSVKEFEEQLTNLRKENFNLKLRIYFLEERMGTGYNLDKESAVKKNIELMVEVESLRKELQEKQDLLCQAVKAMDLEEEEHKKESQEKDNLLQKFQQQIEELEQKVQDNALYQMEEYAASDTVVQLQQRIRVLEEKLSNEREKSVALESYIKTTDSACNTSTRDLEELLQQKDQDINQLYNELHDVSRKFSNCSQRARTLEAELERCSSELRQKATELELRENDLDSVAREAQILRASLTETQELHKKEAAKAEKFKTAVMLCNNKMLEMEKITEAQKLKIRNLEQKLEGVQAEVKEAAESREGSTTCESTDVGSFSVPNASGAAKKGTEKPPALEKTSPTASLIRASKSFVLEAGENISVTDHGAVAQELAKLKEELTLQQEKNLKLKSEQFKACQIIKSMISMREANDKELKALKQQIEQLESENKELKEKGTDLRKLRALHSDLSEIKQFTATSSRYSPETEKSMAESSEDTKLLAEQYKTLSDELEKQIKVLVETIKEKDYQMQSLKDQFSNLMEELKQKEHRITDLEFELLSLGTSDVNRSNVSLCSEKKDVDNEKHSYFWIKQIDEKDKEIERLESELRKRTCDLQGIVNKELWQKNREIEKLQNRFCVILENKDLEISKLESDVSSKEQQLKLLKEKISELGVQIPADALYNETEIVCISDEIKSLRDRLNACEQERQHFVEQIELQDTENSKLKAKCEELGEELQKSEKLRGETNEVCSCLSKRLEELALFLDSLLQQKLVLGFLGYRQNALKQVVNQSLELSKTLSVTMSQNPNQSLMEITNISTLLTSTQNVSMNVAEFLEDKDDAASFALVPSDATLTYRSHLQKDSLEKKDESLVEEQKKIINVLRDQVQNLKHEIELRDTELSKLTSDAQIKSDQDVVNALIDITPTKSKILSPKSIVEQLMSIKAKSCTSSSVKNKAENSESESWSEPDRQVSMARIGLDDESLKPAPSNSRRSRFLTSLSTESTEDELSHTLTRTPSKRSLLAENRQTIISLHSEVCELERKLKENEEQLLKAQTNLNEKEALLDVEKAANVSKQRHLEELLQKIKEIEENYANAEDTRKKAEEQVRELERLVEDLQNQKSELQSQMVQKDKTMLNHINELENEKSVAEKLAEDAKSDVKNAEIKMKNMQSELDSIETRVREECEEKFRIQSELFRKDCEIRVKNVELQAQREIEKAQDALEQLQNVLRTDYVTKTEVEKQTKEVEKLLKELEGTRTALHRAEDKVRELERQEASWKQKLRDTERQQLEKINQLHSELNTANLQYSEAVLEKTRLNNEKISLEQKLKAVDMRETKLMLQTAEFQKEVGEIKEAFQKQVAILESKKIKLEIQVSELESINAELKNKLILMQTGINEQFLSAHSGPAAYRRQFSDNSGYTSEEQQENKQSYAARENVEDVDRQNANSSPDLGIESDQGRFSSLEANIPRPLLQTLELTESMSNLLDGDNQVQASNCNNEQCCKKTQQIVTENNDLKRRLLRTRRALEETVAQLTIANQRKKQVEKTICKQIHKTSQVLRKAKANLDSGSETDVARKQ